jgi:peptidoglycan/LPS O-acetylase OafA/YrhL
VSQALPRPFSVYLDLVRFAAACLVYIYHSNQRWLVEPTLPLAHYGHSSVIVFFVLSGFVIAYITDTKERDWVTYTASRLSRVYSVAVPALVLTLVLDTVRRLVLGVELGYPFDWFALRTGASLLMANEIWFVSITSFSNVPYWSICYEVWYYVAFGLLSFLPRQRAWAWVALLGLLLGPKVVLLAPIWGLGVLLYRWRRLADLSERSGWLLAVGSTLGIAAYLALDIEHLAARPLQALLGPQAFEQLAFSRWFLGDYLLGPLVMLHFAGMRRVAGRLAAVLGLVERPVRALAAYTFTLYLLHQPFFLFWGAVLKGDNKGYGNWWAVTALTAASIALVGALTENRRHRLTAWLRGRLSLLSRPAQASAGGQSGT